MQLSEKGNNGINKKSMAVLFFLYMIALIWVILFKCNNIEVLHIELNKTKSIWERLAAKAIPFQYTLNAIFVRHSYLELLASIFNVVCFLPMGFALRYFFGRKTTILIGLGVSASFEIFQLLSYWGGFDVSDIVLNLLGVYLGVVLHNFLSPRLKSKFINSCVIICIIIAIPFDLFAVANSIINFPGF